MGYLWRIKHSVEYIGALLSEKAPANERLKLTGVATWFPRHETLQAAPVACPYRWTAGATGRKRRLVSREDVRLGGLAGLGVGLFILPFAASDGIIGGLFAPEVLHGASGDAWVARISAHPGLAQVAIALPILGFALMLLVGVTLFRLVADRHWGATLGIVGHLVGVSLAVAAFVSATSLVWGTLGGPTAPAVDWVTVELHRFMFVNTAVGPFFIIVVGNTCLSIAAWRVGVLPQWLCVWGLVNGAIMALGIGSIWWPVLEPAQVGGPSTMLWFMATGVVLSKRARSGRFAGNAG